MKVPTDSIDTLRELSAFTARHGWASLGIDREDPPTMTALMEEAIRLLADRRDAFKGKKR